MFCSYTFLTFFGDFRFGSAMNHHQQCSNSIVRTSGTFVRVLLRWPGQVVYTPGLQFPVLQFPLLFGLSVKFTIQIPSSLFRVSGDFITLSGGGVTDVNVEDVCQTFSFSLRHVRTFSNPVLN
jgi:hypothetical protein